MIGPPGQPGAAAAGGNPLESTGPWDTAGTAAAAGTPDMDSDAAVLWRERERRQRTIRVLMMFLLMLLLMDGDEPARQRAHQNRLRGNNNNGKRHRKKNGVDTVLEPAVWQARQRQDAAVLAVVKQHERYHELVSKNGMKDYQAEIVTWSATQSEQERDLFALSDQVMHSQESEEVRPDPEHGRKIFHYPWNATGFYRGEWTREKDSTATKEAATVKPTAEAATTAVERKAKNLTEDQVLDAVALENTMLESLKGRSEKLGIFLLPDDQQILLRDDHNLTSKDWESKTVDAAGKMFEPIKADDSTDTEPKVTLTHDTGHAAFQLYARSVPGMRELSLVDGFVKLYDSTSAGFSTRKDLLLRVHGVLIHSIGKISLVSNGHLRRSAFVIGTDTGATIDEAARRRRLEEAVANIELADMDIVVEDAVTLFADQVSSDKHDSVLSSPGAAGRTLVSEAEAQAFALEEGAAGAIATKQANRRMVSVTGTPAQKANLTPSSDGIGIKAAGVSPNASSFNPAIPPWSDIVLPYPFVRDDKDESIRKVKTPAARRMPAREQALEQNAASCEFEINLDVEEAEWTVGEWRTLLGHRIEQEKKLNPSLKPTASNTDNGDKPTPSGVRRKKIQPPRDQALVMHILGSIRSPNCDFTAALNVTAIRTDWEATTSKAINYSFYMMLVCLTQIMILLRQLLHSQAQSAATRVSLLCIGWQTVIDAVICLAHIYFSLVMQPLFTAFASVAFFKLLIFCVIEMKYMAIIIQARNSSNGGQSTEVLRRQVAMLHLRFYVSLCGTLILMYYFFDMYRLVLMLGLYSFWIPQIVLNIVTEAKTPMHTYYIYGMSVTRLFVPLYMFALRSNFLKEVWPDSKTDAFMCEVVVLWVLIQTAILVAQGKYGARFMIPARCLPPKFDYSRPLPASMLPPGALDIQNIEPTEDAPLNGTPSDSKGLGDEETSSRGRARHTTAVTTRNRIRGNRGTRNKEGMTADTPDSPKPAIPAAACCTLECSICYDDIDVRDRAGYMLAPCDHIFHRDCLAQWMDIQLACPICRTALPSL